VRRAVRLENPPDPEYYSYEAVYGEVTSVLNAQTGDTLEATVGQPTRLAATSLAELFPDRPVEAAKIDGREWLAPRGAQRAEKEREKVASPRLGPVAVSGSCAFAVRGNALEAMNLETGKCLWSMTLAQDPNPALRMGGSYQTHSDPCVAGGKVFVGTLEGRLLCLNAATGKTEWAENLQSPIGNYATPQFTMMQVQPIVAEGRIYLTTLQGELICIDTGDRTLEGPHQWGGGGGGGGGGATTVAPDKRHGPNPLEIRDRLQNQPPEERKDLILEKKAP